MFTNTTPPFLSKLLSLFILILHLGCFNLSSRRHRNSTTTTTATTFKKKLTPSKNKISSFFKNLFSTSTPSKPTPKPHSIPSPPSSTRSLRLHPLIPNPITQIQESDPLPISLHDIHPCSICGEIFTKSTLLEHHQSLKHTISELIDGENILRIIFKAGWPVKQNPPIIHRILKIHNSSKTLSHFEEYRESVKSKASESTLKSSRDERCIADGNELLRFHCTTFICELNSSVCKHQYCSVCGIINSGFSPKLDGIVTMPTGFRAHVAIPEDIEEEFKFMNVKRALLVCRVIAGRVGCDPGSSEKEDSGFDSLLGQGTGGLIDDELLVFNPRAVLPCFVIVYTV